MRVESLLGSDARGHACQCYYCRMLYVVPYVVCTIMMPSTAVHPPAPYRKYTLNKSYGTGTGAPVYRMTPVHLWPYAIYSTVLSPRREFGRGRVSPRKGVYRVWSQVQDACGTPRQRKTPSEPS